MIQGTIHEREAVIGIATISREGDQEEEEEAIHVRLERGPHLEREGIHPAPGLKVINNTVSV